MNKSIDIRIKDFLDQFIGLNVAYHQRNSNSLGSIGKIRGFKIVLESTVEQVEYVSTFDINNVEVNKLVWRTEDE